MPSPTTRRIATFQNPLMKVGPDPWMLFHDGFYYLMVTTDRGLKVRRAAHIGQMIDEIDHVVWTDKTPGRQKQIWAGEFHLLDGPNGRRWYVYYTASDGVDDHHRLHVLEADNVNGTPLGPYHYKAELATDPEGKLYAIDPDVFVGPDGSAYLTWAGHPGHVLFIQKLLNPWTTTGKRTLVPSSGFGCRDIREGPCGHLRDGKVYLFYSACDTGLPDYKVGLLIADASADLLAEKSWEQHPDPVLVRCDKNGVYGPGHNGLFKSPDGTQDWIVYAAKTVEKYTYAGRSPRAQLVEWKGGLPVIGDAVGLGSPIEVPGGDQG